MAIQIVPREEERSPIWIDILFYLSLILLVATVSSYFILNHLKQKEEQRYASLQQQISGEKGLKEINMEKEVIDYKKKIDDFSLILNSRLYISQIFPFFEGLIHPNVVLHDFSAEALTGKISFSGTTENFQTLGQQMVIFQNEKLIRETKLTDVFFDNEGNISFDFEITLDPKVLQKNE